MAIEFYVVYDAASNILWRGSGREGAAAEQPLSSGQNVLVVPQAAFNAPTIDLAPIKASLRDKIDAEADAFCLQFVTAGDTQMARYERKESEARAWVSGNDPMTAPFLNAEATETGVTIDDLAAAVIAQADAWIAIGAKVEGRRMGAKKAITTAETIVDLVAAATVNWTMLIS